MTRLALNPVRTHPRVHCRPDGPSSSAVSVYTELPIAVIDRRSADNCIPRIGHFDCPPAVLESPDGYSLPVAYAQVPYHLKTKSVHQKKIIS